MEDEREVNQRNRRKLTEIGKNRREETRTGGKIPILQKHSQPVLLLRVSEQLLNTAVSTSDTISVGKSLLPLIIYSYLKWKCIKESKEKSPQHKSLQRVHQVALQDKDRFLTNFWTSTTTTKSDLHNTFTPTSCFKMASKSDIQISSTTNGELEVQETKQRSQRWLKISIQFKNRL